MEPEASTTHSQELSQASFEALRYVTEQIVFAV